MVLIWNWFCVIEKVGVYNDFYDGEYVLMIIDVEIDLCMFLCYWVYVFVVEKGDWCLV